MNLCLTKPQPFHEVLKDIILIIIQFTLNSIV